MRYKLICLFLLLGFGANAQYLHMLERADSSSRKVVVTNNSGIQRYVEVDSLATLLGVNGSVDSLAIVQDTILVYFRSGSELGRDTIGTYNRSQIDLKDALRVLYTDTAAMLLPYITEVEVNDTLSVYYLSSQVDSADALRVLYTDTATMLSSYTRRTELQDTASAIRNDLGADIGAKTDTTAFNQVELTYNPNSQPIINKHYREVDKQTIYIEEINNAAQGVSGLLNTTLSSGRNAYQDAEVVWMADNSDSTITYSNKGADFDYVRTDTLQSINNEGNNFTWSVNYPRLDFSKDAQKAGLKTDTLQGDTLTQTLAGDTIGSILVDCASDYDTELFRLQGDLRKPADYGDSATAAYSLRYVTDSYDSVVVRVRRSSDNAELDFRPEHIGDSLETWVGVGNDGFVTIWYDQMNGNHATQATASAQPKIVNAGALVTENGKAAIDFDGVDDFLVADSLTINVQNLSIFYLNKMNDSNIRGTILGTDNPFPPNTFAVVEWNNLFNIRFFTNGLLSFDDRNSQNLNYTLVSLFNNDSMYVNSYINGMQSDTSNLGPAFGVYTGFQISNESYNPYNGILSELVIYETYEFGNKNKIESEINNYYNISSSITDLRPDTRIIRQADSLKLVTGQVDTTFIGLPTAEDRIVLSWNGDTIKVSLNGADAVSKGVNYTQDYTEWFFSTQSPVTYYELLRWAMVLTENEIKTLTE